VCLQQLQQRLRLVERRQVRRLNQTAAETNAIPGMGLSSTNAAAPAAQP
jgi:hypothetical protein